MRIVTNLTTTTQSTPAAKRSKELSDRTADLTAELARFTIPKLKPSVPATAHKPAAPASYPLQQKDSAVSTTQQMLPPESSAAAHIPSEGGSKIAVPRSISPELRQSGGSSSEILGAIPAPHHPAGPLPTPRAQRAQRDRSAALLPITDMGIVSEKASTSPDADAVWTLRRRSLDGEESAHEGTVGASTDAEAEVEASGNPAVLRIDQPLEGSADQGDRDPRGAPAGVSSGGVGRQPQKQRDSEGWASPGYEPEKEQLRDSGDGTLQVITQEIFCMYSEKRLPNGTGKICTCRCTPNLPHAPLSPTGNPCKEMHLPIA